jgi:hypothetical protein
MSGRRRQRRRKKRSAGTAPQEAVRSHARAPQKRSFPFESDDARAVRAEAQSRALDSYLESRCDQLPIDLDAVTGRDMEGGAYYCDPASAVGREERRAQLTSQAAVDSACAEICDRVRQKRQVYADRYGYKGSTFMPAAVGAALAPSPAPAAAAGTFDPRACEDGFGGARAVLPAECAAIENSILFAECERFLPCTSPDTPLGACASASADGRPGAPCYDTVGDIIAAVQELVGLRLIDMQPAAVMRRLPGNERVLIFTPAVQDGVSAFQLVLWLCQEVGTHSSPLNIKWYVARRFYVPPMWQPAL